MNASLYFASLLLLLSGCSGALFGLIKTKSEFDVDEYDYNGEAIGIHCVYDGNQTGFHQVSFDGNADIPAELAEHLNNGRPLSIYFDGIASHIKPNRSTFKFAREWFDASETNICYITYAYKQRPIGPITTLFAARDMVKSHRLQFTAKLARNMVIQIREKCLQNETPGCMENTQPEKIIMLGFSFGAHIASEACRNIFKRTGKKVGKLIGVDPAGIAITLSRFNQAFITRGDAAYVQVIHTDIKAGTILQTGDVDIFVDSSVNIFNKHELAVYLHMATAMKKLLLVAQENGNGRLVPINPYFPEEERISKPNEVFVGVYSELDESKRGKRFKISFHGSRIERLRRSIAHVVKAHI